MAAPTSMSIVNEVVNFFSESNSLSSYQYQPAARWGHHTAVVNGTLYLWGGLRMPHTYFSLERSSELEALNFVEVFEIQNGYWKQRITSGTPPRGFFNYSCAVIGSNIYYFGGDCDGNYQNNLTFLNTENMEWTEITPATSEEVWPMKKQICGMVPFGFSDEEFLHVVGGFATLSSVSPLKDTSSVSFPQDRWCSEEHIYSLKKG